MRYLELSVLETTTTTKVRSSSWDIFKSQDSLHLVTPLSIVYGMFKSAAASTSRPWARKAYYQKNRRPHHLNNTGENTGELAPLKDMPLDIFFEACSKITLGCQMSALTSLHIQIMSHLSPLDLLRISWSSKHFRKLLMNRNHRLLWVTARRSGPGLPDPPTELSEPRYAALMFTKVCFVSFIPKYYLVMSTWLYALF